MRSAQIPFGTWAIMKKYLIPKINISLLNKV